MIHGRWLLAWQSMSLQVGQVVLGLWRQGKRRRRLRHPPQDPQLATLIPENHQQPHKSLSRIWIDGQASSSLQLSLSLNMPEWNLSLLPPFQLQLAIT